MTTENISKSYKELARIKNELNELEDYDNIQQIIKEVSDVRSNLVDHPSHYTDCSLECIEAMEVIFGSKEVYDFCLLNAFKYIWRYKKKNGEEDLKKAKWYIEKCDEIEEHGAFTGFKIENNMAKWLHRYHKIDVNI